MDETQPAAAEVATALPSVDRATRIREQTFARKRFGYDPDQVHGFLVAVAEWHEELTREVARLRETDERIRSETADAVARELANAREDAERLRAATRDETTRLLNQAEGQADQLRAQAANELQAAREAAGRQRHESAALCESLQQDLAEIRTSVAGLARRLREHAARLEDASPEPGASDAGARQVMVLPEVAAPQPER